MWLVSFVFQSSELIVLLPVVLLRWSSVPKGPLWRSCCVAQVKQCTKKSFVKVLLCCAGEVVYQKVLCEGPVVLCRWSSVPKGPLWRSCCVAQVKQCTKRSFVKVLLCCAGEAVYQKVLLCCAGETVYQKGLCAGEAVYQNGLCEGPGDDWAHPASPGQRQVCTVSLLLTS